MIAMAVRAIGRAVVLAVAAVVTLVKRDALAGADEIDHAVEHAAQVEGDDQEDGASEEDQGPHPFGIPPMHPVEKTASGPKPYAST